MLDIDEVIVGSRFFYKGWIEITEITGNGDSATVQFQYLRRRTVASLNMAFFRQHVTHQNPRIGQFRNQAGSTLAEW